MHQSSKYLILRSLDIFSSLRDQQIEQLSNQSIHGKYNRGSYLFKIGEPVAYVYVLTKGTVKVGLDTSNDKTLIKEIAYTNDLVGENILTGLNERRLFAQVVKDAEAFKIPASFFKALLEQNSAFCQDVTKLLISKITDLEERMNNFVFKKAQSRIVDFLRNMAQDKGLKIGLDEILINHGLSHKEIAHITDTSRQTVARVLGDLKRQNIIHFSARKPHKILVRDILSLT
jgi:CRP/FNR family cyclic AMP-dependent transcriptional regulator